MNTKNQATIFNRKDIQKILHNHARVCYKKINSVERNDYDDIFQECCVGFLKAADSFDESSGVPFKAYLTIVLRNHLGTVVSNSYKTVQKMTESDANINSDDSIDSNKLLEYLAHKFNSLNITNNNTEMNNILINMSNVSFSKNEFELIDFMINPPKKLFKLLLKKPNTPKYIKYKYIRFSPYMINKIQESIVSKILKNV